MWDRVLQQYELHWRRCERQGCGAIYEYNQNRKDNPGRVMRFEEKRSKGYLLLWVPWFLLRRVLLKVDK